MSNNKGQSEKASIRRPDALQLRIRGLSYRQIGAELGVSHVTAQRDVSVALQEYLEAETLETADLRQIENERLDMLWQTVFEKALKGDASAIARCIAISKRRADLNGLDIRQPIQPLPQVPMQDIYVTFADD